MCPEILQSCGTDLRNVTGQTFEKTVVPFSICRILMERMLRKDLASKGSTITPRWHTYEQLPDLPFSQQTGDNWNGYWLKHWYIFAHWCLMVVIFRICLDEYGIILGIVELMQCRMPDIWDNFCVFYNLQHILYKPHLEGRNIAESYGKWRVNNTPKVAYIWLIWGASWLAISSTHWQQRKSLRTQKATSEIKCHTVSFVISMAWIYGEPHWCKDKIEGRERGQKRGDKRGAQSFCCIIEDECWVHWGMSAFWIIYILLMSALI